jgi:hypothetical protein
VGVRCKCGGKLKRSSSEVEFFGIDFGVKRASVCTRCGSEYISQELLEEIEAEVKKRGLFGLERGARSQVWKFLGYSYPERNSRLPEDQT